MKSWKLDKVLNQSEFYKNWITQYTKAEKRIFVIISDAFRFESAAELRNHFTGRYGRKDFGLHLYPHRAALNPGWLCPAGLVAGAITQRGCDVTPSAQSLRSGAAFGHDAVAALSRERYLLRQFTHGALKVAFSSPTKTMSPRRIWWLPSMPRWRWSGRFW